MQVRLSGVEFDESNRLHNITFYSKFICDVVGLSRHGAKVVRRKKLDFALLIIFVYLPGERRVVRNICNNDGDAR